MWHIKYYHQYLLKYQKDLGIKAYYVFLKKRMFI